MIDPSIFRQYDVRGLVDRELTEEAVHLVGRAYATIARAEASAKKITVGRDCRASSPRLFSALVRGLTEGGLDVLDLGVVATPMCYFSIHHFGVDGGIMITGSHNPPEYNGLKISIGPQTLFGDQVQALRRVIDRGSFASGAGRVERVDVVSPYVRRIADSIELGPHRRKVVIDGGNGAAGPFAVQVFSRLGIETIPLYVDMDARFPNHHPDPTVEETLHDLKRAVAEHQADLGVAFDGDGDRIGVIDDRGQVLWGDQLLVLFARAVLAERPGAPIVGEVKCSKTLYDDIAAHGGRPIMWKAGHSLIKAKMKEEGAELAGEMSGHIFFKHRYYGFDDATYAAARLLEIVTRDPRPLSAHLADLPKMSSTPELRLDCPEALKFRLVEAAVARFKALGLAVVDVDGARVTFADGWGLVRASNTQPILVLRFEAETAARRDEIRAFVEGELARLRAELGG